MEKELDITTLALSIVHSVNLRKQKSFLSVVYKLPKILETKMQKELYILTLAMPIILSVISKRQANFPSWV